MNSHSAIVVLCLMAASTAQQLHWQIPTPPAPHHYYKVTPYVDHDGDGCRDLLVGLILNELQPNAIPAHRIVSGMTGVRLWERADSMAGWMVDGGDIDGDGIHDIVMKGGLGAWGWIVHAWSVGRSVPLWQVANPGFGFGNAMLGDVDLDGDGRADFVTSTLSTLGSDVYAYDSRGTLLYVIPCWALGRAATSFAKMGDMDGDGADDYVVGCQDVTSRGLVMLVSGRTGTVLRVSYGLLPGDNIANHASNMGDLDGDGVNDYAGFPWWSAARAMITVFSGQTGAVIRTWPEFANSVITGEDVDLDGVPDLVLGADYPVIGTYGRTYAFSGRDGTELWRVDNFVAPPGSGTSTGTSNWMDYAATVGVRPGEHYPSIAWYDAHWFTTGTLPGRIRAYTTARAGQGPITGSGCTGSGSIPLIGARQTASVHV